MSVANIAAAAIAAKTLKGDSGSRGSSSGGPKTIKDSVIESPIKWLIVVGVVGFVGYRIYKSISKGAAGNRSEREQKRDLEEHEDIYRSQGQRPSYTDYQYRVMADACFEALRGGTEDEEELKPVMEKMRNDVDVAKLIAAFGTRDLSAAYSPWKAEHTLPSGISAYVDDDQIEKYVNAPLRRNGVKFQFQL
jgi:hypothetical protein